MNTGRNEQEKNYSKDEILELIEQIKEKYKISDMSRLGDILGAYHHNWYYYYKNKAKKTPEFLDTLLALRDPYEMFERLIRCTGDLMKAKSISRSDMKKLCYYVKIMIPCLELLAEQNRENIQNSIRDVMEAQDAESKVLSMNNLSGQLMRDFGRLMTDCMYITQLVFYLEECKMQGLQWDINARSKGKENFDLKACYNAHCDTPEFKLSRMKNLTKEDEKNTCWYKERCNSIKKCKIYEYGKKIELLKDCKGDLDNVFQGSSESAGSIEEYMKLFMEVSQMLRELELP